MKARFVAPIIMLSWLSATIVFAENSNDAVAKTCVRIGEYANELGFSVFMVTSGCVDCAQETLDKAKAEFGPDVELFRVTAGPKARAFAFADGAGIASLEKLARDCIGKGSCHSKPSELTALFQASLLHFCRQDYEGA